MNKYTIRIAFVMVFGTTVLLAGCRDGEKPKAKTIQSPSPSVGREYGEMLHGAINQAHGAKSTLEAHSRAVNEADE
jgi:hypothetical protein